MPDIEIRKIQPNSLNPRLEFTKEGLDELADSIRQVGILEPIIVRPKDEYYEVIVGERRYKAAQQAGLDKIPVIVRDYSDSEVMEINLIENIQREELSAVEKAKICKQLMERFPTKYPNQIKVGEKIGVGQSVIGTWLSTLKLPEEIQLQVAPGAIQQKIPEGKIAYKTAISIARSIKEPEKQKQIAKKLGERRLPRRAAQTVIREYAKQPEKPLEQIFREVEEAPIHLPFSKKHADDIITAQKTQTSRKGNYYNIKVGNIVKAAITHFADLEITDIHRKKLGDFDEKDAQREGGYTLEQFKEVWKGLHGSWNPNEIVTVIGFRVANVEE